MDGADTTAAPINPPGRRFDLVDFMIVLVAVAVAFSILWDLPDLYQHLLIALFSDGTWTGGQFGRPWLQLIQGFSPLLAFLLCSAAATILALNLRHPRPPLEHLACQPGFMACATVLLLLVPVILLTVKAWMIALFASSANGGYDVLFTNPRFLITHLLGMMPAFAASAILASWFTLKLSRRWSPQQHWLDRAGRIVGWAWLIVAIL